MELITRGERTEVLPALQRGGTPERGGRGRSQLRFSGRTTRSQRYPVEQRLATLPGPSRIGRHLDIQV